MAQPAVTPCPDVQTLERLLLGIVTGPQAEQLEEHIAVCPRCVATAQSLKAEDALRARCTTPTWGTRRLIKI